jgi:hypothetical protein
MYMISFGPVFYDAHKGGAPLSLVECMREAFGVGHAKVWRTDGTLVVDRAGGSVEVTYAPTGRKLRRRAARHTRCLGCDARRYEPCDMTVWHVRYMTGRR